MDLEHNPLETSTIYTPVSTRTINNIKSPLDSLLNKQQNALEQME
jgi:hypothetical protein